MKRREHMIGFFAGKIRVEICEKGYELFYFHGTLQAGTLRQIGDKGLCLCARSHSAYSDRAGSGGQKTVDQLDKSSLTASVGTEQPDDSSAWDIQCQTVQRGCLFGIIPFI